MTLKWRCPLAAAERLIAPGSRSKTPPLQAPRAGSSGWSLESGSSSLPCVPRKCAIHSFPCEVKQGTYFVLDLQSEPFHSRCGLRRIRSSPLHPGVSGDTLRLGVHVLAGTRHEESSHYIVPSWSGMLNLPTVGSWILGSLCVPYLALIQGALYRASRMGEALGSWL